MGTILDNLPLPVYLFFSFVMPIVFIVKFLKVRKRYPYTLSISIVFALILCIIVSFIRIANEFDIFIEKLVFLKRILLYLFPITILFLIIAAFQKTIRDPRNRLIAVIGSLCIVIPIVATVIIILNS